MMRSILVGLDDSPYRPAVVELAIRWARRCEATLHLLGIIDEPAICRPEPVPAGAAAFKKEADEAQLARAKKMVGQWLSDAARKAESAGVRHRTIEAVGDPEEVILREAQRADVVLVGHQTHFRFATQDGPCDTLHQVLHHTPRAVVTVPETLREASTVVVAYDGSLQAARAVQQFVHSGLGCDAAVHVVSVFPDATQGAEVAQRAVEYLGQHGIQAESHVLEADHVAETLLEQAQQLDAGLMVVGAYGRSRLHNFFLGSVTKKILNQAELPLFVDH